MSILQKIIFLFLIIKEITSIIEIPLTTINITYKNQPTIIKQESLQKISFFQNLEIKEDLKINLNSLIYLTIKIGNPSKEFNLLFDTGSIALWVADKNSDDKYPIINHFDKTYSKTFKDLKKYFEWKYGSGNVKGYYGEDNIYLNNVNFIHTFGVAYSTIFPAEKIDGIIGCSRNFYYEKELLFMNQLYRLGKIKKKVFSVKNNINNRSLFIGEQHEDFNKKNTGSCSLSTNSDYKDIMWTCQLQGFLFGNYSNFSNNAFYDKNYSTLFFDTGTNFIVFPYHFLKIFYNGLNNSNCNIILSNDILVICDNLNDNKNFSLIFGYYSFHIPNDYLFYKEIYKEKPIYISKIRFTNEKMIIIGMPFFELFHTLFDNTNNQLKFYSNIAEITYIKNKMDFFYLYGNIIISLVVIIIIAILIIALILMNKKYTNRDLNSNELPLNPRLCPQNDD